MSATTESTHTQPADADTLPAGAAASAPAAYDRPPEGGWLRRTAGYTMRHPWDVGISLAAAVFGAVCQVLTPLVARQIMDDVILTHRAPLAPWLGALLGLAAVTFVFAYLRRYHGGRIGLNAQNDLRTDMHARLQTLDEATIDQLPTGQLVSRASSDTSLAARLLNFVPMLSGNILMMLMSIAVMLVLSPLLAVISLAVIPALFAISYRMRRQVYPASWDAQQKEGDVVQIVDEDVAGVRVVKAFGQEQRELRRLTDSAVRLYGSQMRAVRIQSKYQPLLQTVPALGQVGILALGGWLALSGHITLGTFLAFATYIASVMAPARQLAGVMVIGQLAKAGLERIFQIIDLQPAIADRDGAVDLPAGSRDVVFDDVTFTYGRGPGVLDGVSLHVHPGERVALVGASGSGKSTLVKLLLRTYDADAGAVRVGGVDVREATLHSLRTTVGIAFEDTFLFSQSVRRNIAYGAPDASDADVERAAQAAQADEFIRALPHGYDTVVGERGLSLSGGQRQRIALARALVRDPDILVLDDATSAIDARTEEHIHEALDGAFAGRTVLLVAHRNSTLRLADRIVVLEDGRITASGTHEELTASSPTYRSLFGHDVTDDVDALTGTPDDADAPGDAGAAYTAASAPVRQRPRATAPASGGRVGAHGGRGAGHGGIAPTTQMLAAIDALPPIVDVPDVDIAWEGRHQRDFSLGRLLQEWRKPLLVALVFVVIDALTGLAGPVVVKAGLDQGVTAHAAGVLFAASGVYLAVTLLGMVTSMADSLVTGRTGQRIMLSLRVRVFGQLQRLSLDYYEREMAGRIMTRMTTDIDQFESLLEDGLLGALVDIVTFAGVGVLLLVLNVPLGLAVMAVMIPLLIATLIYRGKASRIYGLTRERIAIVNAAFQESLSGVRETQAFTHEQATIAEFRGFSAAHLRTRTDAQRLVALYFPFVQFLSAVADAVVLGLGAVLIAHGDLTTGGLIAFVLYISMFFSPIQDLSQVFDAWQQTRVSVARIAELMRLDTLTPDATDAAAVPSLAGDLQLDDVHFAYPTGPVSSGLRGPHDARGPLSDAVRMPPTEAIAGLQLSIGAGETVALVGHTGAGKSTIVKLAARFYDPDRGAVRADGRDLRRLSLGDYRARLGYVPQESFLFTGTIGENVAYGRPDATTAQIEDAARAVGAHHMIRSLPGGYDTVISERGSSLSSGQRQLVALARAQLVDPAVLLLDEATSNLDLATERRVTRAMHKLTRGRTTVLIAHRLQTAKGADRIVVMADGRIVEQGSHDQLLAAGGAYAAMWNAFAQAQAPTPEHTHAATAVVTRRPARQALGETTRCDGEGPDGRARGVPGRTA